MNKEAQDVDQEKIPFISAIFHPNALCVYLECDRDDFWVFLGEFAGWARFRNRDLVYPPKEERLIPLDPRIGRGMLPREPVKEHLYLIVEVIPAGSPPPSPLVSASNVLWRTQEALEALSRQTSYLRGLDGCD